MNPGRDIGATHIHGIAAKDVAAAPRFAQIAPRLVELPEVRAESPTRIIEWPAAHSLALCILTGDTTPY